MHCAGAFDEGVSKVLERSWTEAAAGRLRNDGADGRIDTAAQRTDAGGGMGCELGWTGKLGVSLGGRRRMHSFCNAWIGSGRVTRPIL